MPLAMSCPECGRTGRVPEEYQGKSAKCPNCGARFLFDGCREPRKPVDYRFLDLGEKVQTEAKLRPCPDCNRESSRRATSCPDCGCPLASESQSSPQGIVYINDGAVKVTNIRFMVPNQTYAISGIDSVASSEELHIIRQMFMVLIAFLLALLPTIILIAVILPWLSNSRETWKLLLGLIALVAGSMMIKTSY